MLPYGDIDFFEKKSKVLFFMFTATYIQKKEKENVEISLFSLKKKMRMSRLIENIFYISIIEI